MRLVNHVVRMGAVEPCEIRLVLGIGLGRLGQYRVVPWFRRRDFAGFWQDELVKLQGVLRAADIRAD